MKKGVLKFVFAVLFLCYGGLAQATNIDFNSVNPIGTIQNGQNYNYVTLHDSAIVTMTGGSVQAVWSYDSSTLQLQGGNVSVGIYVWNSSNLVMSGGIAAGLELHGGVAHLSGGSITGSLGIFDSASMVYIDGKNFNSTPNNGWIITGNWNDDSSTPFTIWYRAASAPMPGSPGSQIILIPEPATAFLLGLGIALARKRLAK